MDYFGKLDYRETWEKYETSSYVLKTDEEGNPSKDWVFGEKRRKTGKWRITGPQPAIMVSRVIPSCRNPEVGIVEVDDNLSNIEHLEWIMMRYPLQIIAKNKWDSRCVEMRQLASRRGRLEKLEYANPSPEFKGELREFQKQGLDFLLKTNGVALIADEMGLGKGVTALAYLATEKKSFPVLIIAPLTTLENWRREIEKFLGAGLIVTTIREGTPGELPDSDIYLMNYDLLAKRKDDLIRTRIRTVIADEIHNLRNIETARFSAAKEIANCGSVQRRVGLSGTPVFNRGIEMWSVADFIYPGLLGSRNEFWQMYCGYNSTSVEAGKRDALYQTLTSSIMIRRRKADVLKELPEKTRYRQQVEVDLNLYETEMSKLIEDLNNKLGDAKTDLRKIAQAYSGFNASERQVAGVAKVPEVVNFVNDMMELEESVVVFCHHHIVHDLLMSRLFLHNPVQIIGGQSDKDRQQSIDQFQGKQTRLLIAGLRAGSVGINLTAANIVVFAELDWTPAVHKQCEDRCIAKGQLIHHKTKGLVPIDDVQIGDEILSGSGLFRKVLSMKKRQHRALMTKITYKRWDKTRPLFCTHDHRILVRRKGSSVVDWQEAHTILPGDCLVMPRPSWPIGVTLKQMNFPPSLRVKQVNGRYNGRYIRIPDFIEIDNEMLYLFGWYLAEGWACLTEKKGKYVAFAGARDEIPILEKIGKKLQQLGVKWSIYQKKNSRSTELHVFSLELARFFNYLFGTGARDKLIPDLLMNLNQQQTKALLSGYFDGDGYARNKQQEWITVSNKLISQISLLVLKLGYLPTLRWGDKAHAWTGCYTENGNSSNPSLNLHDEKYVYEPVSRVETFSLGSQDRISNMVYDLEIEEDHSFVVGQAIVHNCHRIGQHHPVFAHYLEGKGTFDEIVANVLVDKKMEIDSIMGDVSSQQDGEVEEHRAQQILAMINKRLEQRGKRVEVALPDKEKILEDRKERERQARLL